MSILFFKIVIVIFLLISLFGIFFTEKLLKFFCYLNFSYYKFCGIDVEFKIVSTKTAKLSCLAGTVFLIFMFFNIDKSFNKEKINNINKNETAVTETINTEDIDMKTVYDFLKKCQTYYLATVENNQPRVRPFGTIDLFENKLYIQTGKIKNVSKQIAQNPKIEICAFDGNTWIRIEATAVNDDRIEAKQHMLDNYPSLQRMYKADDGNTQVLYLKDATATFYSFTQEPKTVKF
ncbi:MAG: pyridoxamine 5'-phosphate oxidase family protein [Endomicrobiaceae bacterium]|nr:pyridoxamine 5'-phosphate oxidase family protein [Endomicrobiaceae bacterium]